MADITLPIPGRPYVIVTATREKSVLDLSRLEIEDLYKLHGALLFRGFPTTLDQFGAFTGQFCATSVFNEGPDRRMLDGERNIQSVDAGSDPFQLHPELSREPWKPDVCFFCCQQPPTSGGATTICDGTELVRELPAGLRDALAKRKLMYIQAAPPHVLEFWLGTSEPTDQQLRNPPANCPYVFRRAPTGQAIRIFIRPVFHTPMFATDPAFGNFLLFARFQNSISNFPVLDDGKPVPEPWLQAIKAVGDRLSAPVEWQAGDLLMLDNTRFMHGRTAIQNADERLIASYFGYLKFAVPNPDEPADPIWRRETFRPPARIAP